MEYFVDMTTRVPAGTSDDTVADIRAREATRAGELAAEGHLLRLWRPPLAPGEWRTFGLFAAGDDAQLDRVLSSMPLHVWRADAVTPLAKHPNDPGAVKGGQGAEFLTTLNIAVPDGTPAGTVEDLKTQEARRARELAEEGRLVRLWTPPTQPGQWRTLGVWSAADGAGLAATLQSLPLYPWMAVETTPLSPHPSDPAGRVTPWATRWMRSPSGRLRLTAVTCPTTPRGLMRRNVLDSIGCAIAALDGETVLAVRDQVVATGGAPRASLIGGGRTSVDQAALFNSVAVRYVDLLDTYLTPGGLCHPADNFGAMLAAAEDAGASGAGFPGRARGGVRGGLPILRRRTGDGAWAQSCSATGDVGGRGGCQAMASEPGADGERHRDGRRGQRVTRGDPLRARVELEGHLPGHHRSARALRDGLARRGVTGPRGIFDGTQRSRPTLRAAHRPAARRSDSRRRRQRLTSRSTAR